MVEKDEPETFVFVSELQLEIGIVAVQCKSQCERGTPRQLNIVIQTVRYEFHSPAKIRHRNHVTYLQIQTWFQAVEGSAHLLSQMKKYP